MNTGVRLKTEGFLVPDSLESLYCVIEQILVQSKKTENHADITEKWLTRA